LVKKMPVVPSFYRAVRRRYELLTQPAPEKVFTESYHTNLWGSEVSYSGPGSDDEQTRIIASEIPRLLADLQATSLLDLPCGDFHWMKNVDLPGIDYTGADIVSELIEANNRKYARAGRRFVKLDLIKGRLPRVDVIFCRDCLVHLPNSDILRALKNIVKSGSGHFLTTTFTARTENREIDRGQWRPLNLEAEPFRLPAPLRLINEGCTEAEGAFADKSLGLWSMAEVRRSLRGR
jgi:hypothetical protein